MRLRVIDNEVELDFETAVPIKLRERFARSDVAHSAAACVAAILGLVLTYESFTASGVTEWGPQSYQDRRK
jgi:hypothetical protein